MDPDVTAPTRRPRRLPRLAPLMMAVFACQEVEQPLGDAPLTGEGGADTASGGTAGSSGGKVGGTGGDTGAKGGAGGTLGGTNAGIGGSAASLAGGAPPMPGGAGSGGGAGVSGSVGDPGDGGDPGGGDVDVRFVVVGPIDPASPTPRAGINYYTDWVDADRDGSIFVGFSSSPDTETDFSTGVRFLWTPEAGTVRLPYSSPTVGMYDPSRLSRDGTSLFGDVMKVEVLTPNSTRFGPVSFYRWKEDTGDVAFGPSEAMVNGQIDFVSADGTSALGLVELEADVEAGGGVRSFLWSEGRGFELLSALDWPVGADYTTVSEDFSTIAGVSDDGQGFLWSDPDRFVPLAGIAEFPYCWVSALSSNGNVAFGGCYDEGERSMAFRWTEATGMVAIDVPGQIYASLDGELAFGTDTQLLYRWSETSGGARLEPPADWAMGREYWMELTRNSLSEDGSTIWGYFSVRVGGTLDAPEVSSFRWSEAEGFVRLASLPGREETGILGQSPDGSIQVGASRLPQTAGAAALWDCEGVRDISLELSEGGADLSGVDLTAAYQVWIGSELMIRGSGNSAGNRVAWIAWLPKRC
jgi:hypothetical protein